MNKSLKTVITVSISALLATILIWWAMKDIDIDKTMKSLERANYWWIGFSSILGIIAYFIRSERWRMLLEPMDHKPKASHAYYAVCMNYFWNLVIPRSGEIARCTTLYTLDKTPIDKSIGTVISERVIDFICLGTVGILSLIFNFDIILKLIDEIRIVRASDTTESSSTRIYILGAVLILIILFFMIFRKKIKQSSIYVKIINFVQGLKQGIKTIFLLKERKKFIIYTLIIWIFYYLMTYIVVFSIPETSHLTPLIGFYLLLVGGIGMVIPASGGIGAYHSALGLGFLALGLTKDIGVTFAFLVHTPHTIIALVSGFISLILISVNKRKESRIQNL